MSLPTLWWPSAYLPLSGSTFLHQPEAVCTTAGAVLPKWTVRGAVHDVEQPAVLTAGGQHEDHPVGSSAAAVPGASALRRLSSMRWCLLRVTGRRKHWCGPQIILWTL